MHAGVEPKRMPAALRQPQSKVYDFASVFLNRDVRWDITDH
jgi:hypothetical protein